MKDKGTKNQSKDQSNITKVFVYGTLKSGYALHGHMESPALFSFISSSFIPKSEKLGLYVPKQGSRMWFPAIFKGGSTNKIKGEVYELKDKDTALQLLDYVEGVPNLYKREVVNVMINRKKEKAYTYIANFDPREYGLQISTEFKGVV